MKHLSIVLLMLVCSCTAKQETVIVVAPPFSAMMVEDKPLSAEALHPKPIAPLLSVNEYLEGLE